MVELRLGLRANLRLSVIICAVLRVSCVEQLLIYYQYDCYRVYDILSVNQCILSVVLILMQIDNKPD